MSVREEQRTKAKAEASDERDDGIVVRRMCKVESRIVIVS